MIKQPIINTIEHVDFQAPNKININDNIPLFWLKEDAGMTFKLDLVFKTGSVDADVLRLNAAFSLLFAGTALKKATEINNEIDLHGGFYNVEVGLEESAISVFGLVMNFEKILKPIFEAFYNADFPLDEFEQLIKARKQKFNVNQQKVSYIARRAFMESLFEGTPFGRKITIDDFDKFNRLDLISVYNDLIMKSFDYSTLIGDLKDSQIQYLIDSLKKLTANANYNINADFTPDNLEHKVIYLEKESSVQSAIRMGKILFNKSHEDYIPFSFMNTLFGGYFGSRLMKEIREEKGYSYGIGSGLVQLRNSGYFFISSEVKKEHRQATIDAIGNEVHKLQNIAVEKDEMMMVKNYMLGQLLRGSDGPFAMMDRYISTYKFGLDLTYFDQWIEKINDMSPELVKEMALKYLSNDNMLIVSAG